jgi:hypothetical protein
MTVRSGCANQASPRIGQGEAEQIQSPPLFGIFGAPIVRS